MFDTDLSQDSCQTKILQGSRSSGSITLGSWPVRDGICVDPPLCRRSSQGKYASCAKGLGCGGENAGKIGEVGERELVLVVSVRCGKERDMTRG